MSAEQELRSTLERVGAALDGLHVAWAVGGSFASTVHGEPRATNYVDIVANLRAPHVRQFISALGSDFYADEPSILQAITARDSFNVIDERSFLKVDLFVPSEGPLGDGQLVRRRKYSLSETGPTIFGGRVSDRQWRDILGVVRLGGELDLEYLREIAVQGGLLVSLERALTEGGR